MCDLGEIEVLLYDSQTTSGAPLDTSTWVVLVRVFFEVLLYKVPYSSGDPTRYSYQNLGNPHDHQRKGKTLHPQETVKGQTGRGPA